MNTFIEKIKDSANSLEKDYLNKRVVRSIILELDFKAKKQGGENHEYFSEDEQRKLIKDMVMQKKEVMSKFEKSGDDDLVEHYRKEIPCIKNFLD